MVAIIGHGAEAVILQDGDIVVKQRQEKSYRFPELDIKLRRGRTRREAKVIAKLKESGIPVPSLLEVNDKDMEVHMEFISGEKVRDMLHKDPLHYGKEIGGLVAGMHNLGIIHQDLTTSNMIYHDGQIVLIDFGLSFFSKKIEDKAVDLHLLERALAAKHSEIYTEAWEGVLMGYRGSGDEHEAVLARFEEVKLRGRNKHG